MRCEKVDLRKVDFKESATYNVWKMFGINILDKKQKKINVTEHYMPQKEQDKLREYMLQNYKKLKYYKPYTKAYISKSISWEVLGYFPTAVDKKVKQ